MFAAIGDQVRFADIRAAFQFDESAGRLAPFLVGARDYGAGGELILGTEFGVLGESGEAKLRLEARFDEDGETTGLLGASASF